jgi:2-amino-4-hydroxy-6-hydroxymethyldihydropteridine diphosphokinase
VTAFVGMGANLGDTLSTIEACLYVLDDVDGIVVDDVSGIYETAPWGGTDNDGAERFVEQPPFLNAVVRLRTTMSPHALLNELLVTEAAFGRDRATETRWGPRVLDLDLLLHGDAVVDDPPRLMVPHPRMTQRAFVLIPLMEVFAGGALPDGRRVAQVLAPMAPLTGIELFVRLRDVPGAHGYERPEGPRAPAAVQGPQWAASRPNPSLDPSASPSSSHSPSSSPSPSPDSDSDSDSDSGVRPGSEL